MGQAYDVLVLDDEEIVGERVGARLRKEGHQVEIFTESTRALERLAQRNFDVVLTDLNMAGPDGLEVVRFVKEKSPNTEVIMLTGYATIESARGALAQGVHEFACKPFKLDEISKWVRKAGKRARKRR